MSESKYSTPESYHTFTFTGFAISSLVVLGTRVRPSIDVIQGVVWCGVGVGGWVRMPCRGVVRYLCMNT
jgi:hypothetical protein